MSFFFEKIWIINLGVKLQDTCVSKSSLGASATIGGSFESFSATLATFVTTIAVGANSIKTPLINDVTTCVTPLAPSFSPSAQPTSSPTSDPTSSAPTVSPSVHPTVLPSGTPTIAHFLSPSKQMTTSPIQQIVAIIAVTETFTNIDSTGFSTNFLPLYFTKDFHFETIIFGIFNLNLITNFYEIYTSFPVITRSINMGSSYY